MSYGTQEEVAALASIWTRNGVWLDPAPPDPGTSPTLTQVETWLTNISAQANMCLQNSGFVTPIDPVLHENSYLAISQYVVSLVSDLCHAKNSSGRFFTERVVERGTTAMAIILKDMCDWVAQNEGGLISDGVPQVPVNVVSKQVVFRTVGDFPSGRGHRRTIGGS